MSSVDHLDVAALLLAPLTCTWFGTWPPQVCSVQNTSPASVVESADARLYLVDDASSSFVRVNFFGSGASSHDLASAA